MSESGLQAIEPPQPTRDDLFDPYEELITIEVLGQQVKVPEKNRLLRCFQYLSMKTISYGDFCWNGDCTNCQVWYHHEGQSEAEDKPALSCRLDVSARMVITRLNQFIVVEGINGSEVGGQRAEIRDQRSEVGDQKSEVRDQRSEVGDQKSEGTLGVPSSLTSDL